jgi:hypothetical protein
MAFSLLILPQFRCQEDLVDNQLSCYSINHQKCATAIASLWSTSKAAQAGPSRAPSAEKGGAVMSHSGHGALIGLVLIALVLMSLGRRLLALVLAILVLLIGVGLYQVVHLMSR